MQRRIRQVQLWQFAFGALIMIMGIFVVIQDVQANNEFERQRASDRAQIREAQAQRDCLASVVQEINAYLETRSDLNEADSESKNRVISTVLSATTTQEIIAARERFFKDQADIKQDRKDHPLPPLPEGKCEQK